VEITVDRLHRAVDHHHRVVDRLHRVVEVQVAAIQLVVAHQPQEAEVQLPKHASTSKTRMATGATRHRRKDGALDCFERFDLFVLL